METELKLAFSSEEELLSCLSAQWLLDSVQIISRKTEKYENRYLDTKDRLLHKVRTSLRVRHIEGADYIHTVKTAPFSCTEKPDTDVSSGLSSRYEWNVKTDSPDFDAESFIRSVKEQNDPLPVLQAALIPIMGHDLEVVCRTVFTRVTITAGFKGSVMEICLDTGNCLAGNGSLPICEMEVELLKGEVSAVQELGQIVMQNCHCNGGTLSKYARCLLLLQKEEL